MSHVENREGGGGSGWRLSAGLDRSCSQQRKKKIPRVSLSVREMKCELGGMERKKVQYRRTIMGNEHERATEGGGQG